MAYANLEGFGWLAEDMQAWTAAHYEPKLRFNSTPVYSVTLAEDTESLFQNPYIIELGDSYPALLIVPVFSIADSTRSFVFGAISTEGNVTGYYKCLNAANGDAWVIRSKIADGLLETTGRKLPSGASGTLGQNPQNVNISPLAPIFVSNGALDKVSVQSVSTGVYLEAGTTITIYAATEV